jgi:putative flippase GtrA
MGPRVRRIGAEAARFSAVNVVATVVAIVLFNLLVHGVAPIYGPGPLHDHPLSSWLFANCVGMVLSFYGSRHYVFRHRRPSGPGGGALNYVAINLASFVVPISCLWVTRNLFSWDSAIADNVSGNVLGAALGSLLRFWAFRRFVFKRRTPLFATASAVASAPEVGPHEAELVEHQPQQRQADPDDVVGVAGHAGDERAAEAVQGEGARHG